MSGQDWSGLEVFMSEPQRVAYGVGGAFSEDQAALVVPRADFPVARRATQTRPEGDDARDEFCEACGHDRDTHRGNRCWVDWQGLSISRSYTQIACDCERFQ